MKEQIERGATSVIRHVFIQDSSSAVGAGLTGLAHDTANLAGAKIRNNETLVTLTFETIATLGTYAAPTSNAHIRIKLLHDTNAPGLYELQFHDDWFNTTNNRRSLSIELFGAANMAALPIEFQLIDPARGLGSPQNVATAIDQITLLDRIGSFTGSGMNTILGFLRALARKDAGITTPSDMGGNYNHAMDSQEGIRDVPLLSSVELVIDPDDLRDALGSITIPNETVVLGPCRTAQTVKITRDSRGIISITRE